MARKLKKTWASEEEMHEDVAFWSAFRLWGRRSRLNNMNIERMLALIKQSVHSDHGAPTMQRVASHGLLSQFLARHAVQGGADPRYVTAAQLEEAGVPLQRARLRFPATPLRKSSGGTQGGIHGATLYRNSKAEEDRKRGVKRTREEYRDVQRSRTVEYNLMDPIERATYERRAAEQVSEARRKHRELPTKPSSATHQPSSSLGLSSSALPVAKDLFLKTACEGKVADPMVSFRSWGPQRRKEFEDAMFQTDRNAIPKAKRYSEQLSCSQMHDGVCCSVDKAHRLLYLQAGSRLFKYADTNNLEFRWLQLSVASKADPARPLPGMVLYAL
jgi:hypothetical protein